MCFRWRELDLLILLLITSHLSSKRLLKFSKRVLNRLWSFQLGVGPERVTGGEFPKKCMFSWTPFVSTVNMNRGDHWAGGGGLQHKLLAISQIRPECPSQDLKGISCWKFYFYHHNTVSEHWVAGLSQSVDPYKRQENVQVETLRHCTNKWIHVQTMHLVLLWNYKQTAFCCNFQTTCRRCCHGNLSQR